MQMKSILKKASLDIDQWNTSVQKAKLVENGHVMERKKSVTHAKLPLLAIWELTMKSTVKAAETSTLCLIRILGMDEGEKKKKSMHINSYADIWQKATTSYLVIIYK